MTDGDHDEAYYTDGSSDSEEEQVRAFPSIDNVVAAYRTEIAKAMGPCLVGDFVVIAEITTIDGVTILGNASNDVASWREIGMIERRRDDLRAEPGDQPWRGDEEND